MEQQQQKEDTMSYMDQCTVVCLGYISAYGNTEITTNEANDVDATQSLCNVVDQELQEFGGKEDLENLLSSSASLVRQWRESDNSEEKIRECLALLESDVDQDNFNNCADDLIALPIETWSKVTTILQLVYRACEMLGTDKLGAIVDVGVRYMRKTTTDFVISQGGWASLAKKTGDGEETDISASIVVVSREGLTAKGGIEKSTDAELNLQATGDASGDDTKDETDNAKEEESQRVASLRSPISSAPAPLSPLNTPPYSFPSSVTTDDERDSLATPPELVERPQMTESYLQAMGEEEVRRISNVSGNGFEIISSENGSSDPETHINRIDDVQAFEAPPSSNVPSPALPEENVQTAPSPHKEEEKEESIFGGYLPHISLGVAVAAAAAGFFVLKKNM